jgi:hypothetical protein
MKHLKLSFVTILALAPAAFAFGPPGPPLGGPPLGGPPMGGPPMGGPPMGGPPMGGLPTFDNMAMGGPPMFTMGKLPPLNGWRLTGSSNHRRTAGFPAGRRSAEFPARRARRLARRAWGNYWLRRRPAQLRQSQR